MFLDKMGVALKYLLEPIHFLQLAKDEKPYVGFYKGCRLKEN